MLIEVGNKRQSADFEAEPGEKLLYAGLRAGVPLPYECGTGTCGTCRGRLREGDIEQGWEEAPGRGRLKPERGDFLMCQATARSGCRIGIPGEIQGFRDDDITPGHHVVTLRDWSDEARDIRCFLADFPTPVSFHAGQFFVLEVPGLPGFRAYSMVNYAAETKSLEFVIKRMTGGGFSEWAFTREGTIEGVRAFGPLGRATFHPDESRELFLVGGGSGIAGLMSILDHAHESGHLRKHRARLFFGVRTVRDLFFADRLRALKAEHPDCLSVTVVFSHEDEDAVMEQSLPEELNWATGFVHEAAISALQAEEGLPDNLMAYLAGPPPMVDSAIHSLIVEAGLSPGSIRYDKFS